MKQKRYQYRSNEGVKWSSWFNFDGPEESIQLKEFKGNYLKNEFRNIEV